jgi:hypothetical protein
LANHLLTEKIEPDQAATYGKGKQQGEATEDTPFHNATMSDSRTFGLHNRILAGNEPAMRVVSALSADTFYCAAQYRGNPTGGNVAKEANRESVAYGAPSIDGNAARAAG